MYAVIDENGVFCGFSDTIPQAATKAQERMNLFPGVKVYLFTCIREFYRLTPEQKADKEFWR